MFLVVTYVNEYEKDYGNWVANKNWKLGDLIELKDKITYNSNQGFYNLTRGDSRFEYKGDLTKWVSNNGNILLKFTPLSPALKILLGVKDV